MHTMPDRTQSGRVPARDAHASLDFLWVELTNRCNLTCVHCYTNSGPHSGDDDVLQQADYERVLDQAYDAGCLSVQFIGGEPSLNRGLFDLTCRAVTLGYEHVEIFSNLTRLDERLVRFAAANRVRFATSFYSDRAQSHDAITGVAGSHARTLANIRRLRRSEVDLRVGLIALGQDDGEIDRASALLRGEGVEDIGVDRVREFGRAALSPPPESEFGDLCGACWSGKLCVTPTGAVYPCIMSRKFPVGDVMVQPLSEILVAAPLGRFRAEFEAFISAPRACTPSLCAPRALCVPGPVGPIPPTCGPGYQPGPTSASTCAPSVMPPQPGCTPVKQSLAWDDAGDCAPNAMPQPPQPQPGCIPEAKATNLRVSDVSCAPQALPPLPNCAPANCVPLKQSSAAEGADICSPIIMNPLPACAPQCAPNSRRIAAPRGSTA